MHAYKDLREFLSVLGQQRQLLRIQIRFGSNLIWRLRPAL